jgi:hypothetical protein
MLMLMVMVMRHCRWLMQHARIADGFAGGAVRGKAAAAWLTWKWMTHKSIFVSKLVLLNPYVIYKVSGFPGRDAWEGFRRFYKVYCSLVLLRKSRNILWGEPLDVDKKTSKSGKKASRETTTFHSLMNQEEEEEEEEEVLCVKGHFTILPILSFTSCNTSTPKCQNLVWHPRATTPSFSSQTIPKFSSERTPPR